MTSPGYAPDGSPVALYRRVPAGDDLHVLDRVAAPGVTVLDLGCGAGRLAHPLAGRGCLVTAVDESPEMLAEVHGCETVLASIEDLRLERTFDVVLLAGNLVNVEDPVTRAAFLRTCRRHMDGSSTLLVQRLDPAWASTAQELESERDGIRYTFDVTTADGHLLAGTVRYQAADLDVSHAFRLQVLDDAQIAAALEAAGLRLTVWLDGRRAWAAVRTIDLGASREGHHMDPS